MKIDSQKVKDMYEKNSRTMKQMDREISEFEERKAGLLFKISQLEAQMAIKEKIKQIAYTENEFMRNELEEEINE